MASPALSGTLFALLCGVVGLIALRSHGYYLLDLAVYRAGGQAWLDSRPLYDSFPALRSGISLPFTYPPFAALCFSVLTLAAPAAIAVAFSVGSMLALLVAVRVTGAALWPGFGWPVAALFTCLAVAFEPVWHTLMLGQINLYLMAIVIVDLLAVRSPRYQGVLTGLAAAVKLTPAVFLLYLVAGRQWRAVGNIVVAFAAVTALAALIRPGQSRAYWFDALLNPERIGGLAYAMNQSVRGALHRLGLAAGTEVKYWAVAVVLILVLGWLTAHRWRRPGPAAPGPDFAGRDAIALIVVAMVGLLLSPVSWSHHWVWLVPALLVLVQLAAQQRSMLLTGTAGAVAVSMLVAMHQRLPYGDDRELAWSGWQHGLGNSYLWLGLLLLGVLLALRQLARPAPASADLLERSNG